MKIAVIGGGVTGLTAAFFLSQNNHQVTLFEKEKTLGGLTASFKSPGWDWPLEKFYHHFFASDNELFSLTEELNIKNKLQFKKPITSVFAQNKIYRFDTPETIIKFPLLNFFDKLRIGATTALLKTNPFWEPLEKITASRFIQKTMGKNSYQMLWQPLLKSKFGSYYEQIPASWFWTRIKKRSFSLGYFEGGNQILIDKLAENIKKNKGKILLNHEVKNLNDIYHLSDFDKVIITTSPTVFLKIAPGLPENFKEKIRNLRSIGAITLVFSLKEKFLKDNTYWLNINEPGFPFVAGVEHTNFIDPQYYGGNHILYVGGYYPQNHRYFKMKKEAIFKEFLPYLKIINPNFDFELLCLNFEVFTSSYAQPVIPLNYSKLLPSLTTPLPNVFFATMHHIYPQDRGINYAILLGKKLAKEVNKITT